MANILKLIKQIKLHTWQVKNIRKAVKKAKNKKTKFIEYEKVTAWLNSWGTAKELKLPKYNEAGDNNAHQ